MRIRSVLASLAFSAAALGCRQNDEPAKAEALWREINDARFQSWQRAPGFPERKPSFTAHSDAVEIFVNDPIAQTLVTTGPQPTEWPVGSVVVKEGFSGDERAIVAVMKRESAGPDGWFWAEYDGEGAILFSGRPKVCVDCHDNRKDYSDWVYSFELPR